MNECQFIDFIEKNVIDGCYVTTAHVTGQNNRLSRRFIREHDQFFDSQQVHILKCKLIL
jgi:hypothetical protein